MLTRTTGAADYDLDRPLPQGDAEFNSAQFVRIHAYYFWQRLNRLPFVVALTYAQQDLVEYDYDLELGSNQTMYFLGFVDLPPKYLNKSTLNTFVASDGVSVYTTDFSTHQSGPTSLTKPGASFANLTFFVELHRYLNQLNEPGNPAVNPGVARYAKSEGRVVKQQEPAWKSSWAQYATQFGLQLLYFGTPSSIFATFPAQLGSTILWYNPSRRPWYQLAVANSGSVVLTAPYVDAQIGKV